MKQFFKRLFCKHQLDKSEEVGFTTDIFGVYMGKLYKCTKCGKSVTEVIDSYVSPGR